MVNTLNKGKEQFKTVIQWYCKLINISSLKTPITRNIFIYYPFSKFILRSTYWNNWNTQLPNLAQWIDVEHQWGFHAFKKWKLSLCSLYFPSLPRRRFAISILYWWQKSISTFKGTPISIGFGHSYDWVFLFP